VVAVVLAAPVVPSLPGVAPEAGRLDVPTAAAALDPADPEVGLLAALEVLEA
jgi:hypothetical protein